MSVFQNWIDGFKPAVTDGEYADPSEGDIEQEGASFPLKPSHDVTSEDLKGIKPTKRPMLKKELGSRHLAFIALGGGIGTGLFVGSGSKLYQGGPGSIIIDYTLMGIMILTVLFALGELATLFPTPGAFSAYSTRFIDPAAGFAIGYNYFMSWCSTLPLEFTAAAIVVRYWNHDKLDPDKEGPMPNGALVAIFWVLVILINLFGARGYAEFEFIATSCKMLVLVGFIIYAAVVDCGGTSGTNHKYLGARYWHDPGAFNNGFKGFCNVFTTAAFAFTGTEVLGLAVAESSNPRKAMPRACKLVLYRVIIFYAIALFMVTLLVPYNTPDLHGKTDNDPKSSPFVIAIKAGQVSVLPDIVNAVIMLSAISVSNSAAYAGSRTLHALADNGMAPQIFAYVDRQGRPLVATLFTLMFGALAFLIYVGDDNGGEVFSWLLGISGLAILFTWSSICISHIRFRAAWKLQGHSLSELPWLSPLGVMGSYIGLTFNILVIIAQFYNSAFPIGEGEKNGNDRGYNFFLGMISLPIIMVFFFGYKIVKKTKIIPLQEIDLVSGMREQISLEEHDQERAERQNRPFHKKVLHFFF